MRNVGRVLMGSALALLAGLSAPGAAREHPAAPQAVAPPPNLDFASDAQTRALLAQAKASIRPGQPMGAPIPLVRVPGYRAVLEYRQAPTPATSHDRDAEFMYVLEGSGTLIMGGTLADQRRPNDANTVGSRIVGGTSHALAPGTFIFVPKAVPHHFAQIGTDGLSVVTMHIPTAP